MNPCERGLSPITAIVLAILGVSAVSLGAFGAHALRHMLSPVQAGIWHTAVQYHFCWVGVITPFGGVAFIIGWIALGIALVRQRG